MFTKKALKVIYLMRNLLAESLYDYIKTQIEASLNDNSYGKETRVFTASFHPEAIKETFQLLVDYLHNPSSNKKVKSVFKVSRGLWDYWKGKYRGNILNKFEKHDWIDLENKLTFYRNLKLPDNYDSMLIVLCGIDKALDLGGLQDFHKIDEQILWNRILKRDLTGWIDKFLDSVNVVHKKTSAINNFFKELHKSILLDLNDLSLFFKEAYHDHQNKNIFHNSDDVLEYLYKNLPRWGIPPIIAEKFPGSLAKKIKTAFEFINYKRYMERKYVKSDKDKLQSFISQNPGFIIPSSVTKQNPYSDKNDYFQSVGKFIEGADDYEKNRLMQVNILPLIDRILKSKTTKKSGIKKSVQTVKGPVFKAFLDSIWEALAQFSRENQYSTPLCETINEIKITVESFTHNLASEEGKDKYDIAGELLKCCIGGIEDTFESMPVNLEYLDKKDLLIKKEIRIFFADNWDEISYKSTNSGNPRIVFNVEILGTDSKKLKNYYFKWLLKDTSEERILYNFSRELLYQLEEQKSLTYLPCFYLPTFNEIFLANDAEEAGRLFNMGFSGFKVKNMLENTIISKDKVLKGLIHGLNLSYSNIFKTIQTKGYFHAVINDPGFIGQFIQRYKEIFNYIIKNQGPMDMLVLLYKAYLFIPKGFNFFEKYLPAAVVTILHPALLEIIQARESFLKNAFDRLLSEHIASNDIKNGKKKFENISHRCGIKRSIPRSINNRESNITSKTVSYGHIQCVGEPDKKSPSLVSQALLREDDEYEEIADKDLFYFDEESKIYNRLLKDYIQLYPFGKDGLEIGIVNVRRLQPIISGIDEYLNEIEKEKSEEDPPYNISISLLSENSSIQTVKRWINAWKSRWQDEDSRYKNCRISIKCRTGNVTKAIETLTKDKCSFDIIFAEHFLDKTEINNLQNVGQFIYSLKNESYLKFPIVEFPFPADLNYADKFKRKRVVSNRRFQIPTIYTEMIALIKQFNISGSHYIIISESDFSLGNCKSIIDDLHKLSNWVVCLDPSIDTKLIKETPNSRSREIIGFSSGVGAQGELNYTVSSDFKSLIDIELRLQNKLKEVFGWKKEETQYISGDLLKQAIHLAGMSIVRATGIEHPRLRDLIAYSIIRKLLVKKDEGFLCNELIVLDSFSHWFEDFYKDNRPDLLHIKAKLKDKIIHIDAAVIECKLGQISNEHIYKAREQVRSGLRIFINRFMPSIKAKPREDFYNARHWWAQLERIIAVNGQISGNRKEVYDALESMTEGDYSICWKGAIVTFWTNAEEDSVSKLPVSIKISNDFEDIKISHFQYGNEKTREICLNSSKGSALKIDSESKCFCPETEDFTDEDIFTDENEIIDENYGEYVSSDETIDEQTTSDAANDMQEEMVLPEKSESDVSLEIKIENKSSDDSQYIEGIPSRVYLGAAENNEPVYWEFGHKTDLPGLFR